MAAITYTDNFTRANVAKLSLDPTLWTAPVDGKCLSIRSNKLLSTWQDDLLGSHNADQADCVPTNMPIGDAAFYTGGQSGELVFDSETFVSMDTTDPAAVVYTDDFNRSPSATLGALWAAQTPSGTFTFEVSATNSLRFHETFLGTLAAYAMTTQMSPVLNQYSQLTYKSGTPINVGPSVRHTGSGFSDECYSLGINASSWQLVQQNGVTGTTSLSTSGSLTLTANDVFKITAVDDATGVQISAYQNGVLLGTKHKLFADPEYIGVGLPGIAKDINTFGTLDVFFDDWQGGEIPATAANPSSVSTEINFYDGNYGVGYAGSEDAPSAHTYTSFIYVFTDDDYQEYTVTLTDGDVLRGEVEIVDALTCNVVAYVNGVEVARCDGADRISGRPSLRGTGSSPEQEHYVDGLQARSEHVWSEATLTLEGVFPVTDEDTRTSIATCVRNPKSPAWHKWKFSGTLRSYSVLDNMLVLSIERGDVLFVETIDISPVPGTRFLDCEILSADMATPVLDTGVTTWTLPFEITVDPDYPLTIVDLATGDIIPSNTRVYADSIAATGDFVSSNVAIGLLYPAQWELSPIFMTDGQPDGSSVALTDGHLQIRHVEFNYSGTGGFTVTVVPNIDDPSQSYEYTFDGNSDDEKGTFRAPVFGQNTKARITVGGTSHRPFAISNFSWTGNISQTTKRV